MSLINSEFTIPCTNHPPNNSKKIIFTVSSHYLDTFSIKDSNRIWNNNEFIETQSNSPKTVPLEELISIFDIKNENNTISKRHFIRYFETTKMKEKGRKRTKETKKNNNKKHDKYAFDNLLTKIQVHFLTFLIDLSNEALKIEFGINTPHNFKYIPYSIKKIVNFNYMDWIKNISIKDILKMKISSKFSTFDTDVNEKTLNIISGKSPWLDEFFNMKYMEAFNYYYKNQKEPLKKIEFNKKEIDLSNSKVKAIYNLLKKDESIKNKLISTINDAYFDGKKYCNVGKGSFVTDKNEMK